MPRSAHACTLPLILTGVRPKSLVLYGASRLGKTIWARSIGSHIYFCGLFSGKLCENLANVTYAVFDDIQGGIKFFHGWKNWLGAQFQFQVKVLYKDPLLITWGKPSIWVSNTDPRDDMGGNLDDLNWLEANCIFINVIPEQPIATVVIYFSCQYSRASGANKT